MNTEFREPKKESKWHSLPKSFSDSTSILIPAMASLGAVIALASLRYPFGRGSRQISETDNFYQYLAKGLQEEKFSDEYFRTAFNHFDRKTSGKLSKYGTVETLEDFVVYLNDQKGSSEATNATTAVVQMLSKARETQPFSALPAEERRLMEHLRALLEAQAPSERVTQAMNELKQVILVRHNEHMRIAAQNTWAIPLSFVGVLLTLLFGLWTTVLTIRQKRMR